MFLGMFSYLRERIEQIDFLLTPYKDVFISELLLGGLGAIMDIAITISYSILVLSIMLIAHQLKNDKSTLTNLITSFKDKVSIIVNFGIIIGLLLYIYLPFFNKVANTHPLTLKYWLYIIILTLLAVLPFDILKLRKRKHVK